MKITFEKKIWFEAKAKLQHLYNFLTERDFQYEPGKEGNVPERIRKILRMSEQEFYNLTGLSEKPKRISETDK
jgi:hypothetical protein